MQNVENKSKMKFYDLRQIIFSAFKNTVYPGDEHLISGKFPPSLDDPKEMYGLYRGKTWEEIDGSFFYSEWHATPTYLTPEAFRYYLPSYMIYLSRPEWDWETGCMLNELLEELNHNTNSIKFRALNSLTNEQAKCVALFLDYLASNETKYLECSVEAYVILDDYWKKFLPVDESNTEKNNSP
jgi:hypothetical protein